MASWAAYGSFVNESKARNYIIKAWNAGQFRINPFDNTIISIRGGSYISTHSGIISKWYISDVGQVRRWGKTHKLIEKIYSELIKATPAADPYVKAFAQE